MRRNSSTLVYTIIALIFFASCAERQNKSEVQTVDKGTIHLNSIGYLSDSKKR